VDRLIEVGLVRKSQNRNSGGGGLTANTYELLPFEESEVAKASPIETLT
jgi:predicted transcriptional regulator